MAVKTISRNGKRVPAESKGKGQKKPRAPKAAATGGKKAAGKKSENGGNTPSAPPPITRPVLRVPRKDYQAFPSKVCGMLAQLRAQRQTAENEERNMVEYRKSLDKWFQTNGDPGDAPDSEASEDTRNLHAERLHVFESKCTSYTRALKAIDAARSVHKWLASKIDSVIDLGMDPKLADRFVDDALDQLTRDAPELPLFKMAAEDAEAVAPGSEHLDKHDGTTEPMKARPVIGRQYFISDKANALIWAVVRVDGPEKKGRFCVTIVKHSAKWDRDPVVDFEDYESREDSTDYSESQDHEPAEYRDLPVDHLQTIESHGAPLVSDSAIACLKRAEIETIRQISKIDGIYGLSDEDKKAIGAALERLEKQAEPVGAA